MMKGVMGKQNSYMILLEFIWLCISCTEVEVVLTVTCIILKWFTVSTCRVLWWHCWKSFWCRQHQVTNVTLQIIKSGCRCWPHSQILQTLCIQWQTTSMCISMHNVCESLRWSRYKFVSEISQFLLFRCEIRKASLPEHLGKKLINPDKFLTKWSCQEEHHFMSLILFLLTNLSFVSSSSLPPYTNLDYLGCRTM